MLMHDECSFTLDAGVDLSKPVSNRRVVQARKLPYQRPDVVGDRTDIEVSLSGTRLLRTHDA